MPSRMARLNGVTDFINYGPDWPPSPEPQKQRRRWPLWKTCAAWTAVYMVVAVAGLIAISVMQANTMRLAPASDSPAPHPATSRRHP